MLLVGLKNAQDIATNYPEVLQKELGL